MVLVVACRDFHYELLLRGHQLGCRQDFRGNLWPFLVDTKLALTQVYSAGAGNPAYCADEGMDVIALPKMICTPSLHLFQAHGIAVTTIAAVRTVYEDGDVADLFIESLKKPEC
jgi:hypothetical protein